ncbi:hypothetical protein [Escherichia coli]
MGMDWMTQHGVRIDCGSRQIIMPSGETLVL